MTIWQVIGMFVLAVLIAVPCGLYLLYILGGILTSWSNERRRECPTCREQQLRSVRFVRARPVPMEFFACDACGTRLKQIRGEFAVATSEEWEMFSSPDFPRNLIRQPESGGAEKRP